MLFDSPATLKVDVVLGWYAVMILGLRTVREEVMRFRLVGQRPPEDMPSELNYASLEEVDAYFDSAREELELSTVFILIASAEARLRVDAKARIKVAHDPLSKRLSELYERVDLDWKVPLKEKGILDAWRYHIKWHSTAAELEKRQAIDCLGKLKDTLALRHWLAHGRYWKINRSIKSYPPVTVAKLIQDLYRRLQFITDQDGLPIFNPNEPAQSL